MKKLLALTLALVMLLSFAACGGAVADGKGAKEEANPAIVKYVEENKGDLEDGMTIEAVGDGIVFTYKDASLDEADDETIEMVKEMFQEEVDALLEEGKKEVPELKWIEMQFLNSSDEVMFTLTAGK